MRFYDFVYESYDNWDMKTVNKKIKELRDGPMDHSGIVNFILQKIKDAFGTNFASANLSAHTFWNKVLEVYYHQTPKEGGTKTEIQYNQKYPIGFTWDEDLKYPVKISSFHNGKYYIFDVKKGYERRHTYYTELELEHKIAADKSRVEKKLTKKKNI